MSTEPDSPTQSYLEPSTKDFRVAAASFPESNIVASDSATATFEERVRPSAPTNTLPTKKRKENNSPLPENDYVDVRVLGSGGMGRVYFAREKSTGRGVAIKVLHPNRMTVDILARFAIEAQSLANLKHEHIVGLHHFVSNINLPHLVLEYVDGSSVAASMKEEGLARLPVDRAVEIVRQAALGVQAANEQGIVHRDLKPENLLVDRTGKVKVADFGLAKNLQADETLTQHGCISGTIGYMAPEQVDHDLGRCDARTDVWGLGATLYSLLIGKPPYQTHNSSDKDKMLAVLRKQHVAPQQLRPDLPDVLALIVQKCLEKRPEHRYATAAEVAEDLRRFQLGEETMVRKQWWTTKLWRRARAMNRATAIAIAFGMLMFASIGASIYQLRTNRPIDNEPVPDPDVCKPWREALQRGERVRLLGEEVEEPKFQFWPWAKYAFGPPWAGEGATSLATLEPTFVGLLDDPGIDDYILSADIRQISGPLVAKGNIPGPGKSEYVIGLCVGYQAHISKTTGRSLKTLLCVNLNDIDHEAVLALPRVGNKTASLTAIAVEDTVRPIANPNMSKTPVSTLGFVPSSRWPGEWRTVEIRVSKDSITARMKPANGAWAAFAPKRPNDPASVYDDSMNLVPVTMDPQDFGFNPIRFNPRTPLGLWCNGGRIAVKNVVIEPIRKP